MAATGRKKLAWIFELLDRMSGPGRKIAHTLDDVDKKLNRTTGALGRHERATRRLGEAHRHAARHGDNFFLKLTGWYMSMQMGIAMVRGLTSAVFGLPTAFAKAGIAAASFKESTMLGLGMMLRDKGLAKALYGEAVNFADISPFETQETLQWYRQLVGAGVGTKGLGQPGGSRILKILAGLGDIASSQPNPSDAMGRMLMQVTQMLNKGRMLQTDMRPLMEAGVSSGEVYKILARRHGITQAEAMGSAWEGKFGAGEALEAILEFSAQRYGGGVLGGGMGPASKTMQGLYSTLKSRPYRLMEDLGETEGFKSLKKALENLVNVLDPTTPTGARIKRNIEVMFDKMLGGVFKRFEDPTAVEAWVNSLIEGFGRLIPSVERLANKVGNLVEHLDRLGLAVRLWSDPVGTLGGAFGGPGPVGLGDRGDVMSNLRRLYRKMDRTPWDDMMLRQYEVRGRELGIPLDQLRPPAKPAELRPASFHFAPGAIQMPINGAADPRAVGDEVEERLSSFFERLAAQQGAA